MLAAFRNQMWTNLPEGQSFEGVFCIVICNFINTKFSRHLYKLPLSILCQFLTFLDLVCLPFSEVFGSVFFLPFFGYYDGFN